MAEWTWSVTPGLSGGRELSHARRRRLTVRRRAAADASFTISGRHEEAAEISELATDLIVRREGQALFRGRIGATDDDVGSSRHELSVSAGDYRALLGRRIFYDADTLGPHAGIDVGELAWDVVEVMQARSGGDLGITAGDGIPADVVAPSATFVAGQSAADAIDTFTTDETSDWEVDAELRLNVFPGGRRIQTDVALDYGANVMRVRRSVKPENYANAGRFTGEASLSPEQRAAADIANRAEGRFDAQKGFPDVLAQPLLSAVADAELDRLQTILPTYGVTLMPGWWTGPSDLWVGHVVTLRVVSGRLDVLADYTVDELDINVGDDGSEVIVATMGAVAAGYESRIVKAEDRLRDLERT